MFESFYNLRTDPFLMSPDHRFAFAHDNYGDARRHLQYGIMRGEGIVVITGESGTGKSTLVEDLLSSYNSKHLIIGRVLSTQLDPVELLRMVADAFGLRPKSTDKASVLIAIQQFIEDSFAQNSGVLLIVDEAQDLTSQGLEALRQLTNIAGPDDLRFQLFLLGQPPLRELVRRPGMEQLRQRIIAYCRLKPLSLQDTREYINHRLTTAGWRGDPAISGEAIALIQRFSRGIPRRINLICSRLMLLGFADKKHQLEADDVREVMSQLTPEMVERNILDDSEAERLADLTGVRRVSGDPEIHNIVNLLDLNHRSGNATESVSERPAVEPLCAVEVEQTEPAAKQSQPMKRPPQPEQPESLDEPLVAEIRTEPARGGLRLLLLMVLAISLAAALVFQGPERIISDISDNRMIAQLRAGVADLLGDGKSTAEAILFEEPFAEDAVPSPLIEPEQAAPRDFTDFQVPDAAVAEADDKPAEAETVIAQSMLDQGDGPLDAEQQLVAVDTGVEPEPETGLQLKEAPAPAVPTPEPVADEPLEVAEPPFSTEQPEGVVASVEPQAALDGEPDSALVDIGGRPAVGYLMQDALRAYSDLVERQESGELRVVPMGIHLDGSTDFQNFSNSVDGLAFVLRNYSGVRLEVIQRKHVSGALEPAASNDFLVEMMVAKLVEKGGVKEDKIARQTSPLVPDGTFKPIIELRVIPDI